MQNVLELIQYNKVYYQIMLKSNIRYSNNENQSPIKLYQRDLENKANTQEILRTNLSTLLKRIAEMEIREIKYIEKIKTLELNNMLLLRENKEQLSLMSKHPSEEIESLIRYLQAEIKRLTNLVNEGLSPQLLENKINEAIQEISEDKNKCVERIQILMDDLENLKQTLQSLKLQNNQLKLREKQLLDEIGDMQVTYDSKTIELKTTIITIQEEKKRLIYDNQILKEHKAQVQKDFDHLRQQIELKFEILQNELAEYEQQKIENLQEIAGLKKQLSMIQTKHYFSFSKHNYVDQESQTQINFQQLVEQNQQLRYYVAMLQYQLSGNTGQPDNNKLSKFKSLV